MSTSSPAKKRSKGGAGSVKGFGSAGYLLASSTDERLLDTISLFLVGMYPQLLGRVFVHTAEPASRKGYGLWFDGGAKDPWFERVYGFTLGYLSRNAFRGPKAKRF